MGLLDSVLGGAMGALQGGGQAGGGNAMLMQVIGALLQGQGGGGAAGGLGGLGGLLQQLQQGGLGEAAQSWVSTGQNLPVSPGQLQSALGADRIDALAQQVGMPAGDLSSQLAQFLPQVVDQLTPNGQLPDGGGNADLGGLLGNVLGGLLKR
jgi:uncharacterized protein YidB (DUF937 family)